MDTKKIKGQFMNRSTFWMIKYMNGSVFSRAKYMNGVGFEILARTPVPKLPLSYRPTPPPPLPPRTPPQELKSRHSERCEAVFFKNFSVTIYRPSFFSFSFFFFFFLNLIYVFFFYVFYCFIIFYFFYYV